MKKETPHLAEALKNNVELKQIVLASYRSKYLKILDELFQELSSSPCEGVETKIRETSPDTFRFQSLISELEFARYFIRNNMKVELLSNNAFGGRKPPDMWVGSDSKEYFVEVKNIQLGDEEYDFGTEIAKALNSLCMSFMVVVKSSTQLSTPTYKYQTREQKKRDCERALCEFTDKLRDMPTMTSIFTVTTAIADIELHPTNMGKSYFGIGTMKQAIGEPPDYKERIRYDVLQKSKKREKWVGRELDRFYIIGVDDNSLFFDIDRYNEDFFGAATYFVHPLPVPEAKMNSEIENAVNSGWAGYLKRMCVLRNDRTVIPDGNRGMFFNEPSMRNVTGILVMHRDTLYLLANPLAEKRTNNIGILTELKSCKVGWE